MCTSDSTSDTTFNKGVELEHQVKMTCIVHADTSRPPSSASFAGAIITHQRTLKPPSRAGTRGRNNQQRRPPPEKGAFSALVSTIRHPMQTVLSVASDDGVSWRSLRLIVRDKVHSNLSVVSGAHASFHFSHLLPVVELLEQPRTILVHGGHEIAANDQPPPEKAGAARQAGEGGREASRHVEVQPHRLQQVWPLHFHGDGAAV